MLSNNRGSRVVKEIVEVDMTIEGKKVNEYGLKNKLIVFTYYLKLFLTFKSNHWIILLNILNLLMSLY